MQEHDDTKIRKALKLAFPAVDRELPRDLWPLMLRRMNQPDPGIPWYDWVLAGAVIVAFVFFPKLALLLAYHL
jgi:hypothetical protein